MLHRQGRGGRRQGQSRSVPHHLAGQRARRRAPGRPGQSGQRQRLRGRHRQRRRGDRRERGKLVVQFVRRRREFERQHQRHRHRQPDPADRGHLHRARRATSSVWPTCPTASASPWRPRRSARRPAPSLGDGELSIADNRVDPSTGTVQLKARFDNAGRAAVARPVRQCAPDPADPAQARPPFPAAAVNQGPKGAFVYVVGADSKVVAAAGQGRLDPGRDGGDRSRASTPARRWSPTAS